MIKNIFLILGIIILGVLPLLLLKEHIPHKELFKGSDEQIEKIVTQINPDYKPWFISVWKPPSSEIESLMFCLQCILGSGLVFYCLGFYHGRKKGRLCNDLSHRCSSTL